MFVGSRSFKCEEERIDHMGRYEQVFGTVFERRGTKCRGALMKHHCKVKGEQIIILQMAQQLKTKKTNIAPGQLFCS